MKRVFSIMLAVMLVLSLVVVPTAVFAEEESDPYAGFDKWDGETFDTTPFAGITADNGGEDVTGGPVIIDTAAKLAGLAKAVNDAGVKGNYGAYKNLPIYITVNVDLGGFEFPSIGKSYSTAMFSGLLEGRLNGEAGKAVTIANFSITEKTPNNIGFVGSLRGGAVKNLTFDGALVGNPENAGGVGIAVGYISKIGEVSGITVKDSILVAATAAGVSCGGVIGTIKNDVDIALKDIVATNLIIAGEDSKAWVGGLVGLLQARNTTVYSFENCYYSGLISGMASGATVGGMVGALRDGSVPVNMTDCQFNGWTMETPVSGAFIGGVAAGATINLTNCLHTGEVVANSAGQEAMVANVAGTTTLTAVNCYSVAEDTLVGAGVDVFTKRTYGNLVGECALVALSGFDFANKWKVNEEALPTLKSVEDELWIYVDAEPDPLPVFDIWDGTTFDTTGFGTLDPTQTYTDPIILDTAAKLAGFAKFVNDAGIKTSPAAFPNTPIYITANVDLGGFEFPSIGHDYTKAMFSGLLEGRLDGVEGKPVIIKGLKITERSTNNLGFVGNLRGGAIKNLTFVNAEVGNATSDGGLGIVVGYVSKDCEVSGITVMNSKLIASGTAVSQANGGVIGTVKTGNNLVLKDIAAVNVTIECAATTNMVGGLVGKLDSSSIDYTLENCYFSGTFVNLFQAVAGCGGQFDKLVFGGLVGLAQGKSLTMKNVEFAGDIRLTETAGNYPASLGSFVGKVKNGAVTVENALDVGQMNGFYNMNNDTTVIRAMIGKQEGTTDITVTKAYSSFANTVIVAQPAGTANATGEVVTPEKACALVDAIAIATTGFDFDATWVVNKNAYPTLKAAAGDAWAKKGAVAHTFDEGVLNKEPTHTAEGEYTYTCSTCNGVAVEVLDKLPDHEWDAGVVTKDATHTEEGEMTYTCVCGEKDTEAIPMLEEHEWNAGVVTKEATHTEKGEKTYTCVCGETYTEEIDETTEHTYDTVETHTGAQHKKVCACGDEIYEDHNWGEGKVTTPATKTEKGEKTYTCACGETKTEEIPVISEDKKPETDKKPSARPLSPEHAFNRKLNEFLGFNNNAVVIGFGVIAVLAVIALILKRRLR